MAAGRKTGGRTKGTPNKTTTEVKDAMLSVYADLQDAASGDGVDIGPNAHFKVWATANPTEFYKLWSKLLPTELKADVTIGLEDLLDAIDGDGGNQAPEG